MQNILKLTHLQQRKIINAQQAFDNLNNVHKKIITYIYSKYPGIEMFDFRRKRELLKPRQLCMFILCELFCGKQDKPPYFKEKKLRLSQAQIGAIWCKDHATVIHAYDLILGNTDIYKRDKEEIIEIKDFAIKIVETNINMFEGDITVRLIADFAIKQTIQNIARYAFANSEEFSLNCSTLNDVILKLKNENYINLH